MTANPQPLLPARTLNHSNILSTTLIYSQPDSTHILRTLNCDTITDKSAACIPISSSPPSASFATATRVALSIGASPSVASKSRAINASLGSSGRFGRRPTRGKAGAMLGCEGRLTGAAPSTERARDVEFRRESAAAATTAGGDGASSSASSPSPWEGVGGDGERARGGIGGMEPLEGRYTEVPPTPPTPPPRAAPPTAPPAPLPTAPNPRTADGSGTGADGDTPPSRPTLRVQLVDDEARRKRSRGCLRWFGPDIGKGKVTFIESASSGPTDASMCGLVEADALILPTLRLVAATLLPPPPPSADAAGTRSRDARCCALVAGGAAEFPSVCAGRVVVCALLR